MSKVARWRSALDALSTLAVLIAALLFIWKLLYPPPPRQTGSAQVEDIKNQQIAASMLTNAIGNSEFALIEFADYQCPFCARHAKETLPEIKKRLIDTGKLKYAFVHFPLTRIHPLAFKASEAAECAADQRKFWEMHERLFSDSNALTESALLGHAESIGLDQRAFKECLAGEKAERILASLQEGQRLQVDGTPAFFLGKVADDGSVQVMKRVHGTIPYETVSQLLDELRNQKFATR